MHIIQTQETYYSVLFLCTGKLDSDIHSSERNYNIQFNLISSNCTLQSDRK